MLSPTVTGELSLHDGDHSNLFQSMHLLLSRSFVLSLLVCLTCALAAPIGVTAHSVDLSTRTLYPRAKADNSNGNGKGAGANAGKETSTMDDLEKQIRKLTKDRDMAIAIGASVVGAIVIIGGAVYCIKSRNKKKEQAARRAEYDDGYQR